MPHKQRNQGNVATVQAEKASTEKAFAAEQYVALIRLAIVIFNSLIYIFFLDQTGTVPWLAYTVVFVALTYSVYVHFFKPYRRFPVMLSSYFTSVTDACLITVWLYATGGVESPYYVLWYAALTSIAFRFSFRETMVAAFIYAASYAALLIALGDLTPYMTDITVRIAYIFFVGLAGAYFAREAMSQVQAKLESQDLNQRLAIEMHERKRIAQDLELSLAQLRATLEATVDGILAVDQSGSLQACNQQFREMWHIPPSAMISPDDGRIFDLISTQLKDPEQFAVTTEAFYDRPESERVDVLELKDGRLIERFLRPQRAEDTSIGWVWSFHDITERTRAAQELEKSKVQLADAQQLAQIGSWDWDMASRKLTWSDELFRIFGSRPQAFVPTYEGFLGRIHPDDREQVDAIIKAAFKSKQTFDFYFRIVRAEDDIRVIHGRGAIIADPEGRSIKMLGSAQDITELKQAEEKARELLVEKERVKLLADFVTSASHDFRTPLATINTSLYMSQTVNDPDKQSRYLRTIESQAQRLTELVDGLFTLTQLDSGQEFRFRPLNLNELVEGVSALCQPKMDRKCIGVTLELDDGLPYVQGDAEMLGEALRRLVDNAANYTPVDGTVTLRTYSAEGSAIVEVRDSGIGIEAEDLPHIFEHFYRADKARATDTGGIGLGLSIAKKVIAQSHGTLKVESVPGQGSTFTVVLPAVQTAV